MSSNNKQQRTNQQLTWIILAIGVLAVSTAAIFIRLCLETAGERSVGFSLFIAASRLGIASLIILPAWRTIRQQQVSLKAYYYAVAAGICLALHFASWTNSLSFTSIAASTTLVTTNAIWVPLFSWLWWREKPNKMTIWGIPIAFCGGILIAASDTSGGGSNSNPLLGDFLAVVGAWMVSWYILFGREAQRAGLSIASYSAIVYTTAALVLFPLPFLFGSGYLGYPQAVYFYILMLAMIPQLIGHTSLNFSLRFISSTLVTLAVLFEPIFSSFLGWLIFGEVPSRLVLVGGVFLLVGVAMAIVSTKNNK